MRDDPIGEVFQDNFGIVFFRKRLFEFRIWRLNQGLLFRRYILA